MSEIREFPCDEDHREEKADAPAVAATMPPVRRLLRAFFAWLASPDRHRLGSLDRMNSYMLRDIGLRRAGDEDYETERMRPLMLPAEEKHDD